jgi:sulfate adenylyltransferase large subunit
VSEPDLLRFTTAGSVDDGKSTLIGRLLYDSKGVYEDQVASVRKASAQRNAGTLDLSLLTDGLRAEREQGITIDVAYRYFSTARRKFIIADTPGHEQYTRNMATGASTAQLAIVLVDARKGVLPQSRRHGYIASLLGIRHLVVAVNKMDLTGFSQDVFRSIENDFREFARGLGERKLTFIPLSALEGDNVVTRSSRTPWYDGPPLLEHLETVDVSEPVGDAPFRFPVQLVIRPSLDFRGYAGQIASGVVRRGDNVVAFPSGRTTRVSRIASFDGDLEEAFAPMAATLCLQDEIDLSRGEMLAHHGGAPHVTQHFAATVVWMQAEPLVLDRPYIIKHTTQQVRATARLIRHRVDIHTLDPLKAERLELNEIGVVEFETVRPLFFDPYADNRATGAFIVIDALSNATAGAGMILEATEARERTHRVSAVERAARLGHEPLVVCIDGREEAVYALERLLFDDGLHVCVVHTGDPNVLRPLADSGAVVIAVTRAAVEQPNAVVIESDTLPPEAAAAARQIRRTLEERGLVPGRAGFGHGEGI